MNFEELEIEVLKLSPSLRAKLAESLLQSLDVFSEFEKERMWFEEPLWPK